MIEQTRDFAEKLDVLICEAVDTFARREKPRGEDIRYIGSESLGEVLEKLIILNVRIWNLEDDAGTTSDTEEFLGLHKKLEICDKITRPRLMEALGVMLAQVLGGKSDFLSTGNVKRFKGYE